MFYACDDPETALRETANEEGQFAVGCFETLRPATILDLTDIPPIPSLFQAISDSLEYLPREVLGFLNHIADEMSKPIQRDAQVHINYIPTQVVTEYVRSQLTSGNAQIDGIKFSSTVHPGHASYVIFATQESLIPAPAGSRTSNTDRWLKLTTTSQNKVAKEHIRRWKEESPDHGGPNYWQRLYE